MLSLTIFLYSTFSIDHTISTPFQTPTPIASDDNNSRETGLLIPDAKNGSSSPSPSPSPSISKPEPERERECDLFKGEWVPNPTGPTYNNTCRFTEFNLNCKKNGRPDSGYLYWKWNPTDCELLEFDPHRFLDMMKNKGFAFIGDSILRNQMKSLLCLLSQVEEANLVSESEDKKASKWYFPSYNLTIQNFWAPYLLKAEINDDINGMAKTDVKIHLDKLDDTWPANYRYFDYVMIGSGPWFTRPTLLSENNQVQGCNHQCPAGKNLTELGIGYSYHKALNLTFEFITGSSHRPKAVFFRTVTPNHFESGKWNEGGRCDRRVPVLKESDRLSLCEWDEILYRVENQEFKKAVSRVMSEPEKKRVWSLRLFDSTFLSSLRPDGHPAKYAYPLYKDKYDCLHWCLPGPIDTWNAILLELLNQQVN